MAFSGSPNRWEENTTTATWVSGECKDLAVITTPLCRLHNIQSPTCRQWKWEKLKRATSCWILVSANRNRKLWNGAVSRRRKKKKKSLLPVYSNKHGTSDANISLAPLFSKSGKKNLWSFVMSQRALWELCLWRHDGHASRDDTSGQVSDCQWTPGLCYPNGNTAIAITFTVAQVAKWGCVFGDQDVKYKTLKKIWHLKKKKKKGGSYLLTVFSTFYHHGPCSKHTLITYISRSSHVLYSVAVAQRNFKIYLYI